MAHSRSDRSAIVTIFANRRPAERITTRTARVAMPTLHSTPSASARARVGGEATLAPAPERPPRARRGAPQQREEAARPPRRPGKLVAVRRNPPGDRHKHYPLLDPVERRVEESAERSALARHARVAPV